MNPISMLSFLRGRATAFILAATAVSALVPSVRANSWTFSASGTNNLGNTISASATFDTSTAGVLKVVLTNTYATVIHAGGADVLTGLYFNATGGTGFVPLGAGLTAGSGMLPNSASASAIPANWGYITSPDGVPGVPTGDVAIASTGLVGSATNVGIYDFTGAAQASPGFLHGPNYGLLGNLSDSYGGFSPLEATSLTFTLAYSGTISDVSGIDFLYGTSVGEGLIHPPGVPDGGATVALLGVGLLGLMLFRRRAALS